MADTGRRLAWRTVNTVIMRSPRFTRVRTPLMSNLSVKSVHSAAIKPSASIAASPRKIR